MKPGSFLKLGVLSSFAAAVLVAAATPARAGHRFPEPDYTSKATIAEAQAILVKEHYLDRGRFQSGRMDDATVEALQRFQRNHMVAANGHLDRDTMALLLSHGAAGGMAPAPAQTAEASTPGSAARGGEESARLTRSMPVTGGAFPHPAILGGLLLAAGALLLRRIV